MQFEAENVISDQRGEVRCREFTLPNPENSVGRPVHGVIWDGPNCKPGNPIVAFGHGASGDRHQAPIPYLAKKAVRELGYFAVSIDGPVHGKRKVGDGARGAFGDEWQRAGCIDDMLTDWNVAIDAALMETKAGKLGYWGLSMGTIFGAPLVAADKRICTAVLGLMGTVGPNEETKSKIIEAAANIHCPVLFLMQLEDELFTRDRYLDLFDRLSTNDKRIHAHPGLHPAVPVSELDESLAFLHHRFENGPYGKTEGTFGPISE
jgi:dienelactone hydrolase